LSSPGKSNKLYFGDNLEVLREYIPDDSVDLIYLDPPFNSQAGYNVLFTTPKDDADSAQAQAFRDAWTWLEDAHESYLELMRLGGGTARFIDALKGALKESDMMAYLVMMAIRLRELHRKLKVDGSLYLHCDPTASHYLKVVLDGVFGPASFRNEIIWKRTSAHSAALRWGDVHDCILFYTKSDKYAWNKIVTDYDEAYKKRYKNVDEQGRRWADDNLTGPGTRGGDSGKPWKGFNPTDKGVHWKVSSKAVAELIGEAEASNLTTREKLDVLDKHGLIHWPRSEGFPRFKRVLGKGLPLQDMILDIPPLNSQAQERTGYPTQKPLTLLDRIIQASSKPGQVVLDPFCGCGTTVEAAERAGRRWIGIDVAVHAVKVIEGRLAELAEQRGKPVAYDIELLPRDFASAVKLAEKDKYQFQWWANYLFNPHALRERGKKGPDRGIDGELFFPNGPGRPWGRMLTSVKGGKIELDDIRAFAHVLDAEKAEMGIFICLNKPTEKMRSEAIREGYADVVHGDMPKLQIVSIEEWFKGVNPPTLPPLEHLPSAAFSRRRRRPSPSPRPDVEQPELPLIFTSGKAAKKGTVLHFNPRMVKAGG
jgi:site-specific DNA-methyltransferase (adenine-specific)